VFRISTKALQSLTPCSRKKRAVSWWSTSKASSKAVRSLKMSCVDAMQWRISDGQVDKNGDDDRAVFVMMMTVVEMVIMTLTCRSKI
jgi:hypothetical protein